MSVMRKYLHQRCMHERLCRDGDTQEPLMNEYGELEYKSPAELFCRKESVVKEVETPNGAVLRSNTRYYLPPSVSLMVGDLIDGKQILSLESYTGRLGLHEGWVVYV